MLRQKYNKRHKHILDTDSSRRPLHQFFKTPAKSKSKESGTPRHALVWDANCQILMNLFFGTNAPQIPLDGKT